MKNRILKVAFFIPLLALVGYSVNAQNKELKIGNNPTIKQPSAVLEIDSNNKGVLFPRVALTGLEDAITIATAADGLSVFNTATTTSGTNDVTPGYYYWNEAEEIWVRLLTEVNAINIYNSDGEITEERTLSGTENGLNFIGENGSIVLNSSSLKAENEEGVVLGLDFSGDFARVTAQGSNLDGLQVGTLENQSLWLMTDGENRVKIDSVGEIQLYNFPNTRDDSEETPADNLLYTDGNGNLRSTGIAAVHAQYRLTRQLTGKTWLTSENAVFEVVGEIELGTPTNVFDLSGTDIPVNAKIIGVRFINKTTNSISTNIISYDAGTKELVLGTAGSVTVLHPAGEYYIILEYWLPNT
ncbi:hypothetical protein MM236_19330 [Belliella sp. DSM 107340]|uniref:Uncharacterized protein n=1 Tax=Belliella calami TaxID=2923436 RepID=A0ABS9UUQ8_9BACT|nr:hypothetical protein [Belliella calami]MCH7400155.1 hypothetical protein [Belliella calami]